MCNYYQPMLVVVDGMMMTSCTTCRRPKLIFHQSKSSAADVVGTNRHRPDIEHRT